MATAEARPTPPTELNGQPGHDDAAAVRRLADARQKIRQEVGRVIVGQSEVIDLMLVGLLCRGHVLLHGVPGLGKTLMARTLADTLAMEFRRVQFTPDLMPSDITGTDIINEDPASGRHSLEFLPGPVFTNFLLADEINRTPPKTQAALLQAMQETEVTVGRQTLPLPRPFFVVATQNPIEMEGTYPLPEAQVDRFMFSLRVGYPSVEEEARIIKGTTGTAVAKAAALGTEEVVRLQEYVRGCRSPTAW
jgi:MoxR-like ATPase